MVRISEGLETLDCQTEDQLRLDFRNPGWLGLTLLANTLDYHDGISTEHSDGVAAELTI